MDEPTKSVLSILTGIGMLAFAAFNKSWYWKKGWYSGDKPAPRWAGILLASVVGVLFIAVGFAHLLSE